MSDNPIDAALAAHRQREEQRANREAQQAAHNQTVLQQQQALAKLFGERVSQVVQGLVGEVNSGKLQGTGFSLQPTQTFISKNSTKAPSLSYGLKYQNQFSQDALVFDHESALVAIDVQHNPKSGVMGITVGGLRDPLAIEMKIEDFTPEFARGLIEKFVARAIQEF